MKKILITGANSYIGMSFDSYLKQWPDKYMVDTMDMIDGSWKEKSFSGYDAVYHVAGIAHSDHGKISPERAQLYYQVNRDLAVETAKKAKDEGVKQFIFMSSLGSYGPAHEQMPHRPITERSTPCPNTAYGQSKLKAEQCLISIRDFPYVIFRPTGIYGPRDKDYALLIDYAMRRPISIALGRSPQSATFIYIADLVEAVFLAIEKHVVRRSYFVTDGHTYTGQDFTDTICELAGHKHVRHIHIPLWMAHIAAMMTDTARQLLGRSFTFNGDKYRILKQRNWTCDIAPLIGDLGYTPQYNLRRGLTATLLERLHLTHHTQEVASPELFDVLLGEAFGTQAAREVDEL